MLFIPFLIIDLSIIAISLPLLFTGHVRWARLAALPAIGLYAHLVAPFPAYRLVLALVFAAALTAFICLLTARLLLSIGPKPPAK